MRDRDGWRAEDEDDSDDDGGADLARDEGLFRIARIQEEHGFDRGREHQATRPCPSCGGFEARLLERGGQNTVRCATCNVHIYNAPKTETGERRRTAQTLRRPIKPGQQARILDRDLGRCVMCGTDRPPLSIGHLLSIEEGSRLGASTAELYSDANLAVMCEACNLGLSHRSVSPRNYAAIMFRLVRAELERSAAAEPGQPVSSRTGEVQATSQPPVTSPT